MPGRTTNAIYKKAERLGAKAAVKVSPPWSTTESEHLRALVTAGYSAAEIASKIPGRTRRAVIGRCHRTDVKLAAARQPLPRRTYHVTNSAGRYEVVKLVPPAGMRHKVAADTPRPARHDRVRLYDHKPGQCRYVMVAAPETQDGVALLCSAARVPGRSWCEKHGQGIYELPKPKVRS